MHVSPTDAQLNALLVRMRTAVRAGRVEVRAYAREGMRELGWEPEDVRIQLLELAAPDFLRVEESTAAQGGLIWVFTPELWDGGHLWIRLVERRGVVIISFHQG